MSKRVSLIAGNWKMNKNVEESVELVNAIKQKLSDGSEVNKCSPRLQSGVSEANSIYKVVKIRHNIKPWRLSSPILRADSVLEIKSETAKNIVSIGDELKIMEEV